jgi:hypothetical protein
MKKLMVFSAAWLLAAASAASADTVTVATVSQLVDAVAQANGTGGNRTILVQDGTYTLGAGLWVNVPNVTIAGQSGNRQNVIIQGDAMSSTAAVGSVITVNGAHFELRDLTLQKCRWHLLQINGQANADYPRVINCIFRDSYEQMLKVTVDLNNTGVAADNGLVEGCLFEYTAGVGPQYYIGGVDAHSSRNWIVRGNTFRNIISPSGAVAEHAVHFWSNSADNIVERNLIIDCDRGIGFGLDGRPNSGGIIRNNMIYHAAGKGRFADVGIALWESPGTQVYNNTIFFEHGYPWSIEYRYPSTSGVLVVNNLSNRPVASRNGGTGTVAGNIAAAAADWFVNAAAGDLHLAAAASPAIDAGQAVAGLTDDYDGGARPAGAGVDVGADEYGASGVPGPPQHLRVVE